MGEEGRRVDCLHLLRRAGDRLQGIAFIAAGIGIVGRESLPEVLGDLCARLCRARAFVPDDRQRLERGLGAPPGVGDHGHCADELAAEHRALLDRGIQHAGKPQVDDEFLAAIQLVDGIESMQGLAGDLPVARLLQHDRLRVGRRQLRCRDRDFTVARPALGRRMRNDAVRHREFPHRHVPFIGRGLKQHHARSSTAAAHVVLRNADAAAAASAHFAPGALGREILTRGDGLGRNFLPVALQLLGDQLREAGARALAHLGARNANHAGVVALDHDPDVHCGAGVLLSRGNEGQLHAEGEATARGGGIDDEFAAGGIARIGDSLFHGRLLRLSCRRACRRRGARRRGCAGRCRSGRCWSWPRRCRRRSASCFSPAAMPPP